MISRQIDAEDSHDQSVVCVMNRKLVHHHHHKNMEREMAIMIMANDAVESGGNDSEAAAEEGCHFSESGSAIQYCLLFCSVH